MDGVKMWFENPTQVRFIDFSAYESGDEITYIGGIVYEDKLICGVCGEIFSIPELYELVKAWEINAPAIVAYKTWVDLSESIMGSSDYKMSCAAEPDGNLNW